MPRARFPGKKTFQNQQRAIKKLPIAKGGKKRGGKSGGSSH